MSSSSSVLGGEEQRREIASGGMPRNVAARVGTIYEDVNKVTRVCYGILSRRLREPGAPIKPDTYALTPYQSCRSFNDRFVVGVIGLSAPYSLGEVIDWMRRSIHPECDARVDPRSSDHLELEIPLDAGVERDTRGMIARFCEEVLTVRVVILFAAISLALCVAMAYASYAPGRRGALYDSLARHNFTGPRFLDPLFEIVYNYWHPQSASAHADAPTEL